MTPEQMAIVELAECVKELIRIDPHYADAFAGTAANNRLCKVYKKASEAKNRTEVAAKELELTGFTR